jgi:2-dehydro-3-deoxy-D-arabinonate dehydratase
VKIARYQMAGMAHPGWGLVEEDRLHPLSSPDGGENGHNGFLSAWLPTLAADPTRAVEELDALATVARQQAPLSLAAVHLLAALDAQEVWAAGVTYLRSRDARLDESGGLDFYDQVYTAARPELFFKALPGRVVGHETAIWVRADSHWSVPEPELAVYYAPDSHDQLWPVGFALGNDVSARDIEGENPLYLPQAKVWERSCALGPYVELRPGGPDAPVTLGLEIQREGETVYADTVSTSRMRRSLEELGAYLGRHMRFPAGVVLLTGTGLVPPADFTLRPGDVVTIRVEGWGALQNFVETAPLFGAPSLPSG